VQKFWSSWLQTRRTRARLPNRLHRWVTKESPAFSVGFDRHGGSAEPPVVATSAINHDRTGNALAFESVQQPAVIAVIAEDRFDPAVFQPAGEDEGVIGEARSADGVAVEFELVATGLPGMRPAEVCSKLPRTGHA
jgi:hypothetical protein